MQNAKRVAGLYSELQDKICKTLEKADGGSEFRSTRWEKEIGSGLTNVFQNGNAIEKGAVNFSFVEGKFNKSLENLLGVKAEKYSATGISSILHPINPHMPIIHMNIRYFALDNGTEWFGGGIDLTPHYVDIAEAKDFHKKLEYICSKYSPTFYPEFKKWADNYFYLPHRGEARGIGGIFFDRLMPGNGVGFEQLLEFTLSLGEAYPEIYAERIHQKANRPYGEAEKKWQELRRGRYVEFNLIYDRGTKFGLESGGNTESILVSMPPTSSWQYNFSPEDESPEKETLNFLRENIDWLTFTV